MNPQDESPDQPRLIIRGGNHHLRTKELVVRVTRSSLKVEPERSADGLGFRVATDFRVPRPKTQEVPGEEAQE